MEELKDLPLKYQHFLVRFLLLAISAWGQFAERLQPLPQVKERSLVGGSLASVIRDNRRELRRDSGFGLHDKDSQEGGSEPKCHTA